LAHHLTVGETYFFRDRSLFQALEEQVLPPLIQNRRAAGRRLRIWSAACCTGEEPYSLAILLSRLVPDLADWAVTILATDVNVRFLQTAAKGVYGEWSFRDVPAGIRDRCFERVAAGRFEILPRFRRMATFSYLNLANDTYPSVLNNTNAMDLVICRNVLMYLTPNCARQVVRNLHSAITEGGWLVVGAGEASHSLLSDFRSVTFSGAILYRKENRPGTSPDIQVASESVDDLLPGEFPPPAESSFAFWDDGVIVPVGPEIENESHPRDEEESLAPAPEPAPIDLARGLYGEGRYAEVEEILSERLTERSDDSEALSLLARAQANRGRLDEALESCDRAVAADKLGPAAYYLRATILVEHSRTDEAIDDLQRAVYLDPAFCMAHFSLGNLVRKIGRPEEARRHWRNALETLERFDSQETLPGSEGMTVGTLTEMLGVLAAREATV